MFSCMTQTARLKINEYPVPGHIDARIRIDGTGETLAVEKYHGEKYPDTPLDAVKQQEHYNIDDNITHNDVGLSIEYNESDDVLRVTLIINDSERDVIEIEGKDLSIIQL